MITFLLLMKQLLFSRKLLWITVLGGIASSIFAQDLTVKGKVFSKDEKSPIAAASIVVRTLDSIAVAVTVSDEKGEFQIKLPSDKDSLLLQAHHINYEDYLSKIKGSEIGNIYMKSITRELSEIVVKASRPMVKGRDGALLYDTRTLLERSSAQDAYTMLSKTPGLTLQGHDLTLVGSPRYVIAINGQIPPIPQGQLKQLLQSMPASQISSVEVFYNAPPQYHVNGAVINIILHEQKEQGRFLQGEVHTTLYHNKYPYLKSGINLNYSRDKLSLSFMYAYDYRKQLLNNRLSSHHTVGSTVFDFEQSTKQAISQHSHLSFINLDYKMGSGKLTATYSGLYTPFIEKELRIKGVNITGNNQKRENDAMHSVSLSYANTNGFQIGASLLTYTYGGKQDFTLTSQNSSNIFFSRYGQDLKTYKVHLDNTHTLHQGWQVGYGLNTSYTDEQDFQSFRAIDRKDIEDTLKEWISSAYIKVGKKVSDNFSFSASLLGEYSKFSDESRFTIIPKADLSYIIDSKNIFQFSLTSGKIYPSYWEKRPYLNSIDGYIEGKGNPSLKPYDEYTARLNYILRQKYVFSLYYTYQPGYSIQQLYQSQVEPKIIAQTQNWKFNRTAGFLSVVPFNLSKSLRFNYTLNLFLSHVKHDHFHDISFNRMALTAYNGLNATFVISKKPDITMDLEGYYIMNPIQGIYNLSNPLGLTAGVKYTFAKGRAVLTMRCTDIANMMTPKVSVRYGRQHFNMQNNADTRGIFIGLKYNFGGYKSTQRKEIDRSRWGHN
ncbi:hypothetical protein HQ38_00610 [Porphyromonas crevioricanis]|uniref:Outer membrane protein beta-barrel domain-containing protein n=2 Tax=Porphyromonadaceae TaxID=171551 RepID=A0AB34PJQ9_9PORP|nr:hypothetical protein JT26_04225 [Porphyromonas sp. COT-108 OH1349]KGN96821.1 hypothetical protein HQ38_00610 [Porphyromonas crevioricanis]